MSQPVPDVSNIPNPGAEIPRNTVGGFQKNGMGGAALVPLIVSIVAIVISLSSCAWMVFSNPAGKAYKRYDFSTPKASLLSMAEMEANNDILALGELRNLSDSIETKERLKTLKVDKEAEWKGKKILFISFDRNGITRYDTVVFEKDDKVGLWLPTRHYYTGDIADDDYELAEAMREWKNKGAGKRKKDVEKKRSSWKD